VKYIYWIGSFILIALILVTGFCVIEYRVEINGYFVKYDKLVSFLFQFLAVFMALITAIIAVLIQSKNKHDKEIESSIECIEYWRGSDFLEASNNYDKVVVKNKGALANLSKFENRLKPDFGAIHNYLSEYEKVAIKVNQKVFDESVIYDQLGIIMYMQYYMCMKSFINGVHEWNPGIYKNTEKLLIKWEPKASKDASAFINAQSLRNT